MSRCPDTGRPGCRGMLCRSAHTALRRLPVERYPADEYGRPDLSAQPLTGWICALVSRSPASAEGSMDIPGVMGGEQPLYVTVAAGSLDTPLRPGDRVEAEEARWRVSRVSTGQLTTAGLTPEE